MFIFSDFRLIFAPNKNKSNNIMSVKGSITKSDYLPYNEYQRLVQSLERDGRYLLCTYCLLSFCLALRISDVLKLSWSDVLGKRSLIVQEKKTGKVKEIAIGQITSEHISKLYSKMGRPRKTGYIFISEQSGRPYTRQRINQILKELKDEYKLNVGNFSSHTFRKTFGRYVYEKKGRSEEALILLNQIFMHASLNTTRIYIGLRDSEMDNIFNSISV